MFTTCTPRSCSYEYVLLSWLGGQQRGCSNVFVVNNKSSSIVPWYITIVCFDFFILFIVPSIFAPPGGLPSASLLKQKVYYSSQNRNDTDKYKGKAIFLLHWYHSCCYRLKNFIPWNVTCLNVTRRRSSAAIGWFFQSTDQAWQASYITVSGAGEIIFDFLAGLDRAALKETRSHVGSTIVHSVIE